MAGPMPFARFMARGTNEIIHLNQSVKIIHNNKQEARGPQFAQLIKTAIAYLQMPCHILPVLSQQLRHKFDHTIKDQRSS